MFNPTEIIFSTTTSCNMKCPHCFINRNPSSLNSDDAIKLMKSAGLSEFSQIEKIGFSGGEPFLAMDFLCQVIKAAIDLDFMFDRIMTNGDWWKKEDDLCSSLQKIYDAGYDGKIGLSYDGFHGQNEERIISFIKNVWDFFGTDSLEIQSVKNQEEDSGLSPSAMLKSLAKRLNLNYEENISESGRGIVTLSDDKHFLPAYIQPESYQAKDSRAFKDSKWFEDDFCEGPGQILFVHATGDIAPCCGFANENKALFIGKITDSFDQIMENAGKNPMIRICYEKGLSQLIQPLADKVPGKSADICTFCDFVCKQPLSI
ncbi:MAG: 4Fe-4S cluster-binding domain-containing protein [Treponema sp.]|nr:4Fe-4S cluster-binding domain-containing protein [Treponema sp.]